MICIINTTHSMPKLPLPFCALVCSILRLLNLSSGSLMFQVQCYLDNGHATDNLNFLKGDGLILVAWPISHAMDQRVRVETPHDFQIANKNQRF